jgi:flagellar protein FliS
MSQGMANPNAAQNYLRAKVLTATPEQLQLMLFDGALRFGEQGRVALMAKKFDDSFEAISRMQKIVMELRVSLKRDVSPDLCDKLAGIYTYVYKKLIEANIEHKVESLDEALKLMRFQRETWSMLLEKLAKEKAARAAVSIDMPEPSERMEASISMRG